MNLCWVGCLLLWFVGCAVINGDASIRLVNRFTSCFSLIWYNCWLCWSSCCTCCCCGSLGCRHCCGRSSGCCVSCRGSCCRFVRGCRSASGFIGGGCRRGICVSL